MTLKDFLYIADLDLNFAYLSKTKDVIETDIISAIN